MKVDNNCTKRNAFTSKWGKLEKNGAADCKEFVASETNDKVSISSLINYLNLVMISENQDQARPERVSELKTLIETGKYEVSGKVVAEKMLSLE